jgi:23S rRNA pseudoU1915 N3-methylase RlmH
MARRIYLVVSWGFVILTLISIFLVLRKPSQFPVQTTPEAAKSFDRKLQEVESKSEQGVRKEVRISETELNSKLAESIQGAAGMPSGPVALKAAAVHLEGDTFAGVFTVHVSGGDVYVTLGGKLGTNNHELQFTATEVKMGSLPLPLSLVEPVLRKKLNSPEMRDQLKLPESIAEVRIEDGELVIQSKLVAATPDGSPYPRTLKISRP